MLRPQGLIVISAIAIAAASCGPSTPTPAPGPGAVTILSPQAGQVFELYESVIWSLQAASFQPVGGFQVTWCNNDNVAHVVLTDFEGEGGPNGTVYYDEDDDKAHTLAPGPCTVKVRAEASGQYGPWSEVAFEVAEPALTNAIQMEILSPQDGEILPLNTPWHVIFKASSPWPIKYFHQALCILPQNSPFYLTDAYPVDGGGPGGTNDYTTDLEFSGVASDKACFVRARAFSDTPENQVSQWVEVNFSFGPSLVLVTPGYPPLLPSATPTIVIKSEIIPFPTPTKVGSWQATAKMNANCRAGPGTAYNEWGYALKGDVVEAVGRSEDGTWLQVLNPHAAGKCWLSIYALDVPFDVNGLPAVSYPTPPPSDEGGDQPPAARGCLVVNAATGELMCVAPCPPGASPERACTP